MNKRLQLTFFHKRLVVIGGAEKLLIEECNAFVRLQQNVRLITYHINDNLRCLVEPKVEIVELGQNKAPKPEIFKDLLLFIGLYRYCKKNKLQYLITGSGIYEVLALSLLRNIDYYIEKHHPTSMLSSDSIRSTAWIRKLIDIHFPESNLHCNHTRSLLNDGLLKETFRPIRYYIESHVDRLALRRAKNVFVLSQYAKMELILLFGIRSEILYGGIGGIFISEVLRVVNRTNTDHENKTIISISRLSPEKNLDTLIKAFLLSGLADDGYKLLLYGAGPSEFLLKKLVADLALDKFIELPGVLAEERLVEVLMESTIFVNVQYADYNINVIEALAADMKVVTSKLTEISPRIENSGCIFRCDVNDVESIAVGLRECASKIHQRKPTQQSELVLKEMGWEKRCMDMIKCLSSN